VFIRLLVKRGLVRTIRFGRAHRVPQAELNRLATEGTR
jgi:hypothetical protein